MKPIEFKEQNIIIAEKQDEYENLPAHIGDCDNVVFFCNKLTQKEIKDIENKGILEIKVLCFNNVPQPISVMLNKPKFPIDSKQFTYTVNPVKYEDFDGNKNHVATFVFKLGESHIKTLKLKNIIYIACLTRGEKLQPFKL